jgi:hypothetical protein
MKGFHHSPPFPSSSHPFSIHSHLSSVLTFFFLQFSLTFSNNLICVKVDNADSHRDGKRRKIGGERFKSVTVWGHDFAPSADDNAVRRAEKWFDIAKALHVD